MKVWVELDYLEALQLVAGAEEREDKLAQRMKRGIAWDETNGALINLIAGELAIRQAFDIGLLPSEAEVDAAHEAGTPFAFETPDVPVALDIYWNRGA